MHDERWTQCTPSEYAWERAALAYLKTLLPSRDPFRAWSNAEFIADDGSVNEVDLLVLTANGLTVVEIKSWKGPISGDGTTWRQARRASVDHPLLVTNRKAKRLKSMLQRTAAMRGKKVPFVEAAVFLSESDVDVTAVSGNGLSHVYGRAGHSGLPSLIEHLARPGPLDNEPGRVKALNRAIGQEIGLKPSPRSRTVGSFRLESAPIQEGPGWQDFVAAHERFGDDRRRVRIYLRARADSHQQAEHLTRAAHREYVALRGVQHAGIPAPSDFVEHDLGPALVFPYDATIARLDHFLAEHAGHLDVHQRLTLLRAVAETVAYAHRRVLTHRALSPQCVWVRRDEQGFQVQITDWQMAGGVSLTTPSNPTSSRTMADLVDEASSAYCAPEWAWTDARGVSLDVFSLGAVAFLLVTGEPPASAYGALTQRLKAQGALHPASQANGIAEELDRLVAHATEADAARRTPDVETFLAELDAVVTSLAVEEEPPPVVDPTEAEPGDELDGEYLVERRLGKGSTAVALLVSMVDDPDERAVLKVALDERKAGRLRAEAVTLALLGDQPGLVRLLDGPRAIGGRTALVVSSAGDRTLAHELRERGRLQPEWLQTWGADLLATLDYLERSGVAHRDIKPDNLGVAERKVKGRKGLVLFDFSLAHEPREDTDAGTPPYLDPFLGPPERRVWDQAAERYAVAVTLYEMATGRRPVYGMPGAHPGFGAADLTVEPELFDRAYAGGLAEFFTAALCRDAAKRHGTAEEMRLAWEKVFASQAAALRRPRAGRLTPETPVAAAGLAPQVTTALERLGVSTAGEAAALPEAKLRWLPGVGSRTRELLLVEVPALAARLAETAGLVAAEPTLLDQVAARLLPADADARTRSFAEVLLGLSEPSTSAGAFTTLKDAARTRKLEQGAARRIAATLEDNWVALPGMTELRQALGDTIEAAGGVAPAPYCAAALLERLGSAVDEPLRTPLAAAVLRAALDAEYADEASDSDPRLMYARMPRGAILVAAGQAAGGDGPSSADRLDWANRLGAEADGLSAADPLPAAARVVAALRAVRPAAASDQAAATDDQLVALAVAASRQAAAAPTMELYPVGLDAALALRLCAGALVGADRITAEQVAQRVAIRYPEAAPLPGRPALDALLEQAGVPLAWDPELRRYAARRAVVSGATALVSSRGRGSLGRATSSEGGTGAGRWRRVEDPLLAADSKLAASLDGGGWLVVSVRPRQVAAAGRALATLPVAVVDVEAVLLAAMAEFASDRKVAWATVLAADAADRSSRDWLNLRRVLEAGLAEVRRAISSNGPAVVLVNAGVLARYDTGLGLLAEVRDGLRTAGGEGALRTLWLLLPWADEDKWPLLDGAAVPMLDTEWLRLPRGWAARADPLTSGGAA